MRIKEVIKEKGLTQSDLANALGVSLSAVKQMLNAPSITTATLEKIAAALNVPVWQLFVSPSEVSNHELTAFVEHRGDLYKAYTMAELEEIVRSIKADTQAAESGKQ